MSTMPDLAGEVTLGVDTHEREHVAALVDELGRLLATRSFPANERGFGLLLAWGVSTGSSAGQVSRVPVASGSASPASSASTVSRCSR